MTEAGEDAVKGPGAARSRGEGLSVDVWEALAQVIDPELRTNIVDLGLVRDVEAANGAVTVRMTLTSPGCPYGPYLLYQVRAATASVEGVGEARVELVWDPPWDASQMSEDARLDLGLDP